MKKTFMMQPRQTGKTTIAVYEFLKDPEHTLLVVPNQRMVDHIIHDILRGDGKYKWKTNIFSSFRFEQLPHIYSNTHRIILDEYMFFDNKELIYKQIQSLSNALDELLIFSTSNKQYKKTLYEFCKNAKYHDFSFNYLLPTASKYCFEEDFNELYYNFLTDPDTTVIDTILIHNQRRENESKSMLSRKEYELEVENIWLVDSSYPTLQSGWIEINLEI